MAHAPRPLALIAALAALCAGAAADDPLSPAFAADQAAIESTYAAVYVAADDRAAATGRLDAARAVVFGARDAASGRARRSLDAVRRKIDVALHAVAKSKASDASVVAKIRAAARAAHAAAKSLWTADDGPQLLETKGDGFHRRDAAVEFRTRFCDERPLVEVTSASSNRSLRTFLPDVEFVEVGRFRATLGPDCGGALVTATLCGVTRRWVLFDGGPRGALRVKPPATPSYGATRFVLRAGAAATVAASLTERATSFDVEPPLPAGLTIDPDGRITGAPVATTPAADYFVIARNRRGAAATTLTLKIAPELPAEVAWLHEDFAASPVATGLNLPVKMALAPDGRLFFNELTTGRVRVLAADGTLLAQPFATVPVLQGGERGLIGIALSPDFGSDGHVFVYATTPADASGPDRGRVLRFTAAGDVGTDPTVIVDGLPVAEIHDGGVLAFGPDGKLYLTIGDTMDSALSQTDGARAGRILRFEADGTIPADNPVAGDPEWCRGLRNSFGLTFHAPTGGLFATENGPAANDELNFIVRGKNYEWGAEPEEVPGPQVGRRMIDWSPVIVPTGLSFVSRGGFGPGYETSLFVAGYDQADLRQVVLSGPALVDVEEELPFARWKDEGVAQKPLDVLEALDGSLWVSTFTAVWRISRY